MMLVVLPPSSPELQPAERLWALVDAPLVNRSFATLDDVCNIVEYRCAELMSHQEQILGLTHFHWWPSR